VNPPPFFLSVGQVLHIHARELALFGGLDGVRDQGALESAVGMAQVGFGGQRLHRDLHEMGAAYAFHIAQAQALIDGNKRTALGAALVFLALNGVTARDPDGRLYDAMIAIAERRLDKAGLAALLRELSSV
jgi:death on curing protein